jgi:GNAT superfamily N-acetyltransferase
VPSTAPYASVRPFEYRRAGPEDVDALVDLRIDFMRIVKNGGMPDEDDWRSELRGRFASGIASGRLVSWICLEGGRVVAASGIAFDRPGRPRRGGRRAAAGETETASVHARGTEALVLNMYTSPERRRLGIASALLERTIGEARSRGVSRLRLQPTPDSRRLYESFGFVAEGGEMALELSDGA